MDDRQEMMEIYSGYGVLVDLIKLREDSRSTSVMKDQIQILEQGLQFLVIYREILSLFEIGEQPEGKYLNFGELPRIDATLQKKGISDIGVLALDSGEFQDWETLASELLIEIHSYRPFIREDCSFFSDGLYNGYWFLTDYLLTKFMRYTNISMANVLLLKGDTIPTHEMTKFESLKEKMETFSIVFDYVNKSNSSAWDFESALNAWVWNASYLCLLYWVLDENMAPEGNVMLSKLYRNFDFPHPRVTAYCLNRLENNNIPVEELCKVNGDVISPDIRRMCLSYLKATKPSADKRHEAFAIVFRFFESLHWNLRAYLPKEAIEMLCGAMAFLIAFVMDPPSAEANVGQLVLTRTQEALEEVTNLIISLDSGDKDEAGIIEATNFLVHDFFEMIITIKAEVRKTFSHLFLDPSFNFPRLNVLNLFDSSIENIKEFPSCFSNHPLLSIEKGLVVIRDLLNALNLKDNFVIELRNESTGLQDLWTRIANVAYQADKIIKSYIYQDGLGLDIFFLQDLKEEIKSLLPKVKRIKSKHVHDSYKSEQNLNPIVPLKSDVQEMDEVIVGLEGKAKEIRD